MVEKLKLKTNVASRNVLLDAAVKQDTLSRPKSSGANSVRSISSAQRREQARREKMIPTPTDF